MELNGPNGFHPVDSHQRGALTAVASGDQQAASGDTGATAIPPLIHAAWVHLSSATTDAPLQHAAVFDAAEALVDVSPPYPPAQPPLQVVPLSVAVAAARTCLHEAARESTSIEERLRISRTLRILRRVQVPA